MTDRLRGVVNVIMCSGIVFLPGSLIFSFPGVMARYWMETFDVGRAQIGQILFFVLAAVGIFMFLVGRLQEKMGPKWLAAMGSLLCAASVTMVGYATSINTVYLWAFLTGVSSAFLYLPALTVVQLWFTRRRGLVSGLVNMSFALSAAIMGPIYTGLLRNMGYSSLTLLMGVLVLMVGLAASAFIRFPALKPAEANTSSDQMIPVASSMTLSQSLRTKSFWLLWLIWAFAGASSIAMVTLSSAFGMAKGLSLQQAVLILTAFNLTNGFSRLFSGFISDIIGRKATLSFAFAIAGGAYLVMNHVEGLILWAILATCIGISLGTLFSVSAPLVSDCFGMDHFGVIYGLVFTAYGFVAGALGPWLSGYLLDVTRDNFTLVFTYLGIFLFVSALLTQLITTETECLPGNDMLA